MLYIIMAALRNLFREVNSNLPQPGEEQMCSHFIDEDSAGK